MDTKKEKNEEIISVNQLCKLLEIKPPSAYKLLKNPLLKSFKIGKKRYITKESFNTYILSLQR